MIERALAQLTDSQIAELYAAAEMMLGFTDWLEPTLTIKLTSLHADLWGERMKRSMEALQ